MGRTCEMLILRFGNGNVYINFEQFCMMMEFLKEQKKRFTAVDVDRSGNLDSIELAQFFDQLGMPMPPLQVHAIGHRYDQDNSGSLEFDEFLQLMVECVTKPAIWHAHCAPHHISCQRLCEADQQIYRRWV